MLARQTWCNEPCSGRRVVFAGESPRAARVLWIESCAGEKTRRPVAVTKLVSKLLVEARKRPQRSVARHFATTFEAFPVRIDSSDTHGATEPASCSASFCRRSRLSSVSRCAGEKTLRPVAVTNPAFHLAIAARNAAKICLKGAVCWSLCAQNLRLSDSYWFVRHGATESLRCSASFRRGTPNGPRAHVVWQAFRVAPAKETRRPVAVTNPALSLAFAA